MDIKGLIETALRTAVERANMKDSSGAEHHRRSREFVKALAGGLVEHYPDRNTYRAFFKDTEDKETPLEFGMNELLYDVMVCEIGHTESPRGKRPLAHLKRAVWQIESEFARNGREALYDFNKLVVGTAEQKLFVGPRTADDEAFRTSLLPAAKCCAGEVYLALLPHPDEWEPGCEEQLLLFRLSGGAWLKA